MRMVWKVMLWEKEVFVDNSLNMHFEGVHEICSKDQCDLGGW